MRLSISIEGLPATNWANWKVLVQTIEQAGFPSLFCSDHFPDANQPETGSLEVYTALTYLADHSQRVNFGTLVSPVSFRDPVVMARQAIALNDLSEGRMILGIGSGWQQDEHTTFGYDLGDIKTRMDRLEEGLKVITQLTRSDKPVTFDGQFYKLREARLPHSKYPLRLLIGGNGKKRTLPLVARYADVWSAEWATADAIQERNVLLDNLLGKEGRQPHDVKRTTIRVILCWRNDAEREQQLDALRRAAPMLPALPTEQFIQFLKENIYIICGTPNEVIEKLHTFETAGIEEFMCQYITLDHPELLSIIAEFILPHFNSPQ